MGLILLALVTVALALGLASVRVRTLLRSIVPKDWRGAGAAWLAGLALAALTARAEGLGVAPVLVRWAPYLALAPTLFAWRRGEPGAGRLGAAALAVWLPLAVGVVPTLALARPSGQPLEVGYAIPFDLSLFLVLVYRPVRHIGYELPIPRAQLGRAVLAFAVCAACVLPLGLVTGFVAPGFGVRSPLAVAGVGLSAYFLTAIPEELLFRGMLQNALERLLRPRPGLAAAALLFGLAHLGDPPAPNWRYAVLASIAGLAYGYVYQRTRSITTSAVTHALVDWTWVVGFGRLLPRTG